VIEADPLRASISHDWRRRFGADIACGRIKDEKTALTTPKGRTSSSKFALSVYGKTVFP